MTNDSPFLTRMRGWLNENDVAVTFGDRTVTRKLVQRGAILGDVTITGTGDLTLHGTCAGDAHVQAGGRYEMTGVQAGDINVHGFALIPGTVMGDIRVHPGGQAIVSGRVFGDVTNSGGAADVTGNVFGSIGEESGETYISAGATVSDDVTIALRETQRTLEDSRIETAVLEERQRIAREVHDTVAQGFTSIVMHLEAAEQLIKTDPDGAQTHLDSARRMARESLGESRRSLWALRPEMLEQEGLLLVLIDLVFNWSTETGCAAHFALNGEPCDLSDAAEMALLRAAQEALANCRKHARATRVDVTLTFANGSALLDVQDDGVGFDPSTVQSGAHSGLGLLGLRERLAVAGGSLNIESAPGEGTTVAVQMRCGAEGAESSEGAKGAKGAGSARGGEGV
jgi:signal transduction histidine kinase